MLVLVMLISHLIVIHLLLIRPLLVFHGGHIVLFGCILFSFGRRQALTNTLCTLFAFTFALFSFFEAGQAFGFLELCLDFSFCGYTNLGTGIDYILA